MHIRRWMRPSVCALLVCAAVVAGGPGLDSVGKMTIQARALTAALVFKHERLSPVTVLHESNANRYVVLAALATLQLAGIVAFEAWVFSRRRND